MSDGNLPPRPPGGSSSAGLPKSFGAPVWSITRKERKEMTPPTRGSRESSEEKSSATDSPYQSRTVTSTERVQIVQMPLELSEASVEQLRMLTLSPRTEASREVCTTSTTIGAGSVHLIGGVTANGVPTISGVFVHGESRQTTTIITTTTTTYKILEDEGSGDDFELVDLEDRAQTTSELSGEMPLRMSSKTEEGYVMVKEGTESSITSTSEDEGPLSSLTSADEREDETRTLLSGVAKTNIVVIPSRVKTPPYSPQSFANTSTFSSPSSRGSVELVPEERAQQQQKWEIIVGKLNATELGRELKEEPLQKWIMLSDGRREISTQTAEAKKISITWSPEMEIASTSKMEEHKSRPIEEYVQVYSNGYSCEAEQKGNERETEQKRRESERIKPKPHHEDFPVSEPFTGQLDETARVSELFHEPIDARVSVYSAGRSDEHVVVQPTTIAEAEPVPLVEYPRTTAYDGPLQSTSKGAEMEGQPLDAHVSAYHHGRSDMAPPAAPKETITTKLTSIFKKTTAHEDEYPPKTEPFLGPVAQTDRQRELEAVPVVDRIERIPKGFYEEGELHPVVVHEEKELTPSEAEKRPGTLERITHLFKRTATEGEWPMVTEPFTGPHAETSRKGELEARPLGELVAAYASGRSDEVGPMQTIETQAATTTAREHYPATVSYEGPLSATTRKWELEGAPLNSHVTVYHHGRSDLAAPEQQQPVAEKVTTKISSLFKRKPHHEDFPVSEPFTGQLDETARVSELFHEPIDARVSVYSAGRSDEHVVVQPTTIAEAEPVPLVEYPRTTAYDGPLQSTSKGAEMEGQPLDAHVSAYHHGRSDMAPPAAPKETITTKLTSIFKKTTAHEDEYPPKTEPFLGPVAQTDRQRELEAVPVVDRIERIPKGFYEEGELHPVVVHEEKELTPSENFFTIELRRNANEITNSILDVVVSVQHHGFSDQDDSSLRGSIETIETILVRPSAKPTELEEISSDLSTVPTQIHVSIPENLMNFDGTELMDLPIDKCVIVYHCGISYGIEPELWKAKTMEKIDEDQIKQTQEMDTKQLEDYVTVYHHGWYGRFEDEQQEQLIDEEEEQKRQFDKSETDRIALSVEQKKEQLAAVDHKKKSHELSDNSVEPMEDKIEDGIKPIDTFEKKPAEKEEQTLIIDQQKRTDGRVTFEDDFAPSNEPLELHVQIKQIGKKTPKERDFGVPFGFESERTKEIYSRATSLKDERIHGGKPPPLRHAKAETLDEQRHIRPLLRQKTSFSPRGENLSIDSSKVKPRAHYVAKYPQQQTKFSAVNDVAPPAGPRRHHAGWTTVTETTLITYAKRHTFERTVNGRKQNVVEDIIVYNHGGPRRVPPGLPKSPMVRQSAFPPQYLDERYNNISGRYNYYRSRSQENDRPRTHDKWMQTEDEPTTDSTLRRSESRSIRTVSRSEERTYRAYSSQLYDRHAYIRDYKPQRRTEEHNEHFARGWQNKTERQNMTENGRDIGIRRAKVSRENSVPHSTTFPVTETNSTFNIRRTVNASVDGHHWCVNGGRTFTAYSSSLRPKATPAERTVHSLHYQRANIEELPIAQLLRQIPHLWEGDGTAPPDVRRQNGGGAFSFAEPQRKERTVPLETRLLRPGEHWADDGPAGDRRRHSAPIHRARQRISNYCTML